MNDEQSLEAISLETQKKSPRHSSMVPLAILVAGLIVAGAIYLSSRDKADTSIVAVVNGLEDMRPVTSGDHILGNPSAPIKIVEYSDMECPFCKKFHTTMKQIVSEYGVDGGVAWVYRHFPLDSLHPVKARKEAVASECVAELGGNSAFWKFIDRFFELTPSNNKTNIDIIIPQIVREIGLDEGQFNTCLESGRYDAHIQDDLENAIKTGGKGTPWSIVVTASGPKYPLSGSQSYETIRQLIELVLQEK